MTDRAHKQTDDLAEEIIHGRTAFSETQAEALKEIAEAYLGLKAFGRLAGVLKTIVTYIGWMLAIWLVIRAGAIDFIRGVRP